MKKIYSCVKKFTISGQQDSQRYGWMISNSVSLKITQVIKRVGKKYWLKTTVHLSHIGNSLVILLKLSRFIQYIPIAFLITWQGIITVVCVCVWFLAVYQFHLEKTSTKSSPAIIHHLSVPSSIILLGALTPLQFQIPWCPI